MYNRLIESRVKMNTNIISENEYNMLLLKSLEGIKLSEDELHKMKNYEEFIEKTNEINSGKGTNKTLKMGSTLPENAWKIFTDYDNETYNNFSGTSDNINKNGLVKGITIVTICAIIGIIIALLFIAKII